MKQNLNWPYISNCVHSIYIILGIVSNLGFPGGSVGKESTCNARDTGDAVSTPGSGGSWLQSTGSQRVRRLKQLSMRAQRRLKVLADFIGYMQRLCHFIQGTWASLDFGICRGPGTNPLSTDTKGWLDQETLRCLQTKPMIKDLGLNKSPEMVYSWKAWKKLFNTSIDSFNSFNKFETLSICSGSNNNR